MKQVVFTYSNKSKTRHNAQGLSIATIINIVGKTITDTDQVYDTKTRQMRFVESEVRVVRADII